MAESLAKGEAHRDPRVRQHLPQHGRATEASQVGAKVARAAKARAHFKAGKAWGAVDFRTATGPKVDLY